MDLPLLLAAALMGAAGSLHCTAMCGAACAAVVQRSGAAAPSRALLGFHLGRLASYAAGGAVAAASVNALGSWAQALPARAAPVVAAARGGPDARPLAGLDRAPAGLDDGVEPHPAMGCGRRRLAAVGGPALGRRRAPLGAAAIGGLWVAVPCGLLQSALLVAALASTPLSGAVVMAAFALASSLGLVVVAAAWQRSVASPTRCAGPCAWPA